MSKIFRVSLSRTKAEVLREASRLLRENSMEHAMTESGGSFTAKGFTGSFRIMEGHAEIEITQKPLLVPWFAIESKIKSYFV